MDRKVLLGTRIKEIRAARRLSQERLAEKMGANVTYLSSIERGKENPTLEFLLNLADGLGIEIGDLFAFAWVAMNERDLRKKMKAVVDHSDLDRLRELFALMKAREL